MKFYKSNINTTIQNTTTALNCIEGGAQSLHKQTVMSNNNGEVKFAPLATLTFPCLLALLMSHSQHK